jgi:hypothetical protein
MQGLNEHPSVDEDWVSLYENPAVPGEYYAAMEPRDCARTARRWWNGEYWSSPYHTFWPAHLKSRSQNERCQFSVYFKPTPTSLTKV